MGRVLVRQLQRASQERIISEREARESRKRNATERSNSSVSTRVQDNEVDVRRQFMSEISMEKNKDPISEIVINIGDNLQKNKTPTTDHISDMNKSRKMCKVPNNSRGLHTQSFDPRLVSIGPFHRHQKHLKQMEEHKWRLLTNVLKNMNMINQENFEPAAAANTNSDHQISRFLLVTLVDAMKELEANARACYSEKFDDFDSSEFVKMMLLDGCFVVELLRLYAKYEQEGVDDDPIFISRWMVADLQHDLILFENQLPYTVLERIFMIIMITSSGDDEYSLEELTLKFFDSLLPRENNILSNCKVDSNPDHLLGLFRSSFLPSYKLGGKSSLLCTRRQADDHHCYQQQFSSSITIGNNDLVQVRSFIRCATKLKEAGVVFKKRENEDLLNIDFKDGKLHIPYLFIDDHTGQVLLNFVAYEQCNRSSTPYFTQYLMFIEGLLKSSKDVEHLHSKGIIDHAMNCNEDVAQLFSKLCKEVVRAADDCYLSEPLKDVNLYTQVKKHSRLAKWKEDYAEWKHRNFRSPWAFLSFLAAIFLLVFTAIQTLFSVLAYVSPRS